MSISKDEMTNLLMSFLKNKTKVAEGLSDAFEQAQSIETGMERLREQIDQYGEDISVPATLSAMTKSMQRLAKTNKMLTMIVLVYAAGGGFSGDSATMLTRLGKGQEALRELWKQKINGG